MIFVEGRKLEKIMIFYVSGQSDDIFTYQAGNLMNEEILKNTVESLEVDVESPIKRDEERRLKLRESV